MNKVYVYSLPYSLKEEETCRMLRGENTWLIKFSRNLKENRLRPDEVTFERRNALKFICRHTFCRHMSVAWDALCWGWGYLREPDGQGPSL